MIVSNLFSKGSFLVRPCRRLVQARFGHQSMVPASMFSSRPKMTVGDSMEHVNDLFAQMNREMGAIEGSGLAPRVVSQKEDVIYIKNPAADWKFNRVLNFDGDKVSAITLCLQHQQAIALLLSKATALSDSQLIE